VTNPLVYGHLSSHYCVLIETESYKHSITGMISPSAPSETGGGILADEMGMGKSLTVLSHIARTSDRSRTWAELTSSEDGDLLNETIASRSTLIVVPSARE
jgi:SWI/SNF-related matrix-associated actin-dependent regulator of chromatin subfamily A3